MLDRRSAAVARQLGNPHGYSGRLLAWLLNRLNASIITQAVRALDCQPGWHVADIGFGGGLGLRLLLDDVGVHGTVTGADISADVLVTAARRHSAERRAGRLRLMRAAMADLPLEDDTLDGVITCNTLYFIADLDAALREVARVLRPGGRLVVGIGDPDSMAADPVARAGFTVRPVDDVVAALKAAEFSLEQHRTVGEGRRGYNLLVTVRQRVTAQS